MDTYIADTPRTRFNLWAHRARAQNQSDAWEKVRGQREEVNAFYLDGLAMLRRGSAAGVDKDAIELMARALHDAIGDCVGKMERTLDEAGCNEMEPIDLSELEAFCESAP
jgi:hypothetical protein